MILPGKHLRQDRSLLGIGGEVLTQLTEPRSVSELWERTRLARTPGSPPISFDWFVLTLSFLYSIAAIDQSEGIIFAKSRQ
ncbi:hypothetical protein ACVII1_007220 [Bradyrhizobium elkanii]